MEFLTREEKREGRGGGRRKGVQDVARARSRINGEDYKLIKDPREKDGEIAGGGGRFIRGVRGLYWKRELECFTYEF